MPDADASGISQRPGEIDFQDINGYVNTLNGLYITQLI